MEMPNFSIARLAYFAPSPIPPGPQKSSPNRNDFIAYVDLPNFDRIIFLGLEFIPPLTSTSSIDLAKFYEFPIGMGGYYLQKMMVL